MHIFVIGSFVQACCWQVKHIPKPGQTLEAHGIHIEPGGKGLNVAICCQRLGLSTTVLLGIGEDSAGDDVLKLLIAEYISSKYAFKLAAQSGYGAGMIAADGQNAIAVYPGPNLLLNATHVQQCEQTITQADVLYGQFEAAYDAIDASFAFAKTVNPHKVTVLNPSPYQNIGAALFANTDVILVNEIEIFDLLSIARTSINIEQSLSGWQNYLCSVLHDALSQLFSKWQAKHNQSKLLVVTLGELGCVAIDSNFNVTCASAFKVAVKDTIGCGDAFASGFCVSYLRNTLENTLRYANGCGAIVASKQGVLTALPTHKEVAELLLNYSQQDGLTMTTA